MIGNQLRAGLKPAGGYKPGHIPWNANLKGIHLSSTTEFKPGQTPLRVDPVGAIRIRTRKRSPTPRAWVKVADPNVWRLRACVVWEEHNGPIPRGKIIHHQDRDPLNDDIGNLRCLTKKEHAQEHKQELTAARWPQRHASP